MYIGTPAPKVQAGFDVVMRRLGPDIFWGYPPFVEHRSVHGKEAEAVKPILTLHPCACDKCCARKRARAVMNDDTVAFVTCWSQVLYWLYASV